MTATKLSAVASCSLAALLCLVSPSTAERPDVPQFSGLRAEDDDALLGILKSEVDGVRVLEPLLVCSYVGDPSGDYMYVYGFVTHPDSLKYSANSLKGKQGAWLTMQLRYYTAGEGTPSIERSGIPVEACKASFSVIDKDKNLSFYDDADQAKFKLACSGDLAQALSLSSEEAAKFRALAGDEVSCSGKAVGDITAGCFRGDTTVAAESGPMPIRDVKVGDMVWSWDEKEGKKVLARVSRVYVRPAVGMRVLRIGDETVRTTDEHPFYVDGKGWTKAAAMTIGDRVKLAGGEAAVVTANAAADAATYYAGYVAPATPSVQTVALAALSPDRLVYNIEVDGNHNYFVGRSGVLVHNK